MLMAKKLLASVVAVAGLDEVSLLMESEIDLMVAVGGGVRGRGVTETVLGSQFFGDLVVDLGDVLVLLHLEETASGLLGHALEDLFTVGAGAGWIVVAAVVAATSAAGVSATATGISPAWVASAGVSAAGIAAATTLWIVVCGMIFFSLEVDGVDDGVGALGGLDGFDEGFAATTINAVREDDDSFAAGAFAHDLVGGEEESVVKGGAPVMMAAAAVGGTGVAGGVDLFESRLEESAGGGQVLQELSLMGELGDEGLIFGGGEHLVEKGAAGGALLVEDFALGEAGVDEQAERKGEIGVLVEVTDGLGFAIDLQNEVVFREVLYESAFLVADDDGQIDQAGVYGER